MQSGNRKAKFARDRHEKSEDSVWSMDTSATMGSATTTTSNRSSDANNGGGAEEGQDKDGQADAFSGADDYDDVDYDDDRFFGAAGTDDAPNIAVVKSAIDEDEEGNEGADDQENVAPNDLKANNSNSKKANTSKKGSVFDIDESKLIKLDREVEKIQIGYSVIPKKVNVKQLKVDIWDQVATLAGVSREGGSTNSHGDDDDENEPPPQDFHATQSSKTLEKSTETTMSFQNLVNTVAKSQKQKEVTLSFYFICLLHLANEKTLKITDDKNSLDELIVSGDAGATVGAGTGR